MNICFYPALCCSRCLYFSSLFFLKGEGSIKINIFGEDAWVIPVLVTVKKTPQQLNVSTMKYGRDLFTSAVCWVLLPHCSLLTQLTSTQQLKLDLFHHSALHITWFCVAFIIRFGGITQSINCNFPVDSLFCALATKSSLFYAHPSHSCIVFG